MPWLDVVFILYDQETGCRVKEQWMGVWGNNNGGDSGTRKVERGRKRRAPRPTHHASPAATSMMNFMIPYAVLCSRL